MFSQLLNVSAKLMEFLPLVGQAVFSPLYDFGFEYLVDTGNLSESIYNGVFEILDGLFSADLALMGYSVYDVNILALVLGPGLLILILLSVIYFVMNIVDTVVPL